MSTHTKFPLQSIAEATSAPAIELEGQKVLFDKKVSLLPADVKKQTQPISKNEGY